MSDGVRALSGPERNPFGITLHCGCVLTVDGNSIRVDQRCDRDDLEQKLQDAFTTIRVFVGEVDEGEGCPSQSCPYEARIARYRGRV